VILGSVVGRWTLLEAGRSRDSFLDEVIRFFSLPNPSSRSMIPEVYQAQTEMSTRKFPGYKGWPAGV
jgi:hypothetical protein